MTAFGVGCSALDPGIETAPAHSSFALESTILGETRRINVYPQDDPIGSLPTLYLLDGGIHEDFPHVATTVDSLVRSGAIAPIRVVGIENTQRRRDVTPETSVASDREIAPQVGGAANFRAFLRDELIPSIEARFGRAPRRAILGESLAGLFVVDTLLTEPGLFDDHIAISPSLWWDDGRCVRTAEERLRDRELGGIRLYLTAANEEGIAAESAALATALQDAHATGLAVSYIPRPDLEHSTIFKAVEADAYRALFSR